MGRLVVVVALLVFFSALSTSTAAAAPAPAAGCSFIGFAGPGTGTFAASPSWRALELENRAWLSNRVQLLHRTLTIAPGGTRVVRVHRLTAFTITSQHSGTAIYACVGSAPRSSPSTS